jgi:tetratricopeptide (TPR) repeat protein
MTEERITRFWELMRQGYAHVKKSELQSALDKFEGARRIAVRERRLADKAIANKGMVLLEMGQYARASRGLREIILRSRDDETICGAAYNLSISLRRQGQHQKASFYARLALEKARIIKDQNWIARCHNLYGNLHLAQSRFSAALKEYGRALAVRLKEKKPNRFSIGILKDNIGYCLLLTGRFQEGIKEIREGIRYARMVGNRRCLCECEHDLAFGLMQLRSLAEAEVHGERALKLAEELDCREIVRNCFYILGEINHLKGDEARRDYYFYKLQGMHPNMPFLRDFLCKFDVSKIIALRQPQ